MNIAEKFKKWLRKVHGATDTKSKDEEPFMTDAEIVAAELLEVDVMEALSKVSHHSLIGLHHTYGRYLRNKYGMWNVYNPHSTLLEIDGDAHPDQRSMRIITILWQRVQHMGLLIPRP